MSTSAEFWRKDPPVLDDQRRVVVGGMWPHQRLWWDAPNFTRALVTGYGGGKTYIGAKRAIALALHNAPAPVLFVSPTYALAKRTIIPAITDLLDGKRMSYTYNKTDHEFNILARKGARIWIASGDEPNRLKGPNISACLIDEPFIQSKEVYDQCVARVRDPASKRMELDLLGTPEQLNWGYDLCTQDPNIFLVQASTKENRALSPDYYSRLANAYTDKALLAYGEGQFVNLSTGLVYYAFEPSKHVVEPKVEWFNSVSVRAGMDFNVNPMSAVVFVYHNDVMTIIDEIQLTDANTDAMARRILERHPGVVWVYPDASGGARKTSAPIGITDHVILQEHGYRVQCHPSNPPVRDRENAVNGALAHGKLRIWSTCKNLIKAMTQYTHELKHKQQELSHIIDAMGYPVEYLMPLTRDAHRVRIGAQYERRQQTS